MGLLGDIFRLISCMSSISCHGCCDHWLFTLNSVYQCVHTQVYSFIHSFIHSSFVRLFVHSYIHSFIHSLFIMKNIFPLWKVQVEDNHSHEFVVFCSKLSNLGVLSWYVGYRNVFSKLTNTINTTLGLFSVRYIKFAVCLLACSSDLWIHCSLNSL